MNRKYERNPPRQGQAFAGGQGDLTWKGPQKSENECGIQCVQENAGGVVASSIPSPNLVIQDMREPGQRVIVRACGCKRPLHGVPSQTIVEDRLLQVLFIVSSQKSAVDARPVQPDRDRTDRQPRSGQLFPSDAHDLPRIQSQLPVTLNCGEMLRPYNATITEAVTYYVEHVLAYRNAPPVSEIAKRMVAEAESAGRRETTVKDLRLRLERFSRTFGKRQLAGISLAELKQWLDDPTQTARTRIKGDVGEAGTGLHRKCDWTAESIAEWLDRNWKDIEATFDAKREMDRKGRTMFSLKLDEMIPFEKLREALSTFPEIALPQFPVLQDALARLFSLAYWGDRAASVAAKKALEDLLPRGNRHPITPHLPKIIEIFGNKRKCIIESSARIIKEEPQLREVERVKILSALYSEDSATILDAIRDQSEKAFLAKRISTFLPVSTTQAMRAVTAALSKSAK